MSCSHLVRTKKICYMETLLNNSRLVCFYLWHLADIHNNGFKCFFWHCANVIQTLCVLRLIYIFISMLCCTHVHKCAIFTHIFGAYICVCTVNPVRWHMFNAHPLARLMMWTRSGHGGGWSFSLLECGPPTSLPYSSSQGIPLGPTNWIKYTWCLQPPGAARTKLWCFCWAQHHGQLP